MVRAASAWTFVVVVVGTAFTLLSLLPTFSAISLGVAVASTSGAWALCHFADRPGASRNTRRLFGLRDDKTGLGIYLVSALIALAALGTLGVVGGSFDSC